MITDDEIEEQIGTSVEHFTAWMRERGVEVVLPGQLATRDYRPHARNRYFAHVVDGLVVNGTFG